MGENLFHICKWKWNASTLNVYLHLYLDWIRTSIVTAKLDIELDSVNNTRSLLLDESPVFSLRKTRIFL